MAISLGLLLHPILLLFSGSIAVPTSPNTQHPQSHNHSLISHDLFVELEELARIVDISYCVGATGLGIQKPFQCLSRCDEFENFELVTVGA